MFNSAFLHSASSRSPHSAFMKDWRQWRSNIQLDVELKTSNAWERDIDMDVLLNRPTRQRPRGTSSQGFLVQKSIKTTTKTRKMTRKRSKTTTRRCKMNTEKCKTTITRGKIATKGCKKWRSTNYPSGRLLDRICSSFTIIGIVIFIR